VPGRVVGPRGWQRRGGGGVRPLGAPRGVVQLRCRCGFGTGKEMILVFAFRLSSVWYSSLSEELQTREPRSWIKKPVENRSVFMKTREISSNQFYRFSVNHPMNLIF
jgi:hypothetical protein